MAITQTTGVFYLLVQISRQDDSPTTAWLPAAIGFPIVISFLMPLRAIIIPRFPFTEEELAVLDGPTASPFVSPLFGLKHTVQ